MDDASKNIIDQDLYKGLKAQSELSFPKICNTCCNRYENIEEFIDQTETIRQSSGLKEDLDDEDSVIVGLFRNCTCGSTLMDEFTDRRNLTKSGLARRKKFGKIIGNSTFGISPKEDKKGRKSIGDSPSLNKIRNENQTKELPPSTTTYCPVV